MKDFALVTLLGVALLATSLDPKAAWASEKTAASRKLHPENSRKQSDSSVLEELEHPDAGVRVRSLRLLAERYSSAADGDLSFEPLTPAVAGKLTGLARLDGESSVRAELARLARRLPAANALPVLRELFGRAEDVEDTDMALLEWSALESKARTDRNAVLEMLRKSAVWRSPMFSKFMVSRLAQCYAAEPTSENQDALAWLLVLAPGHELAPGREFVDELVHGMEAGLQGKSVSRITPALKQEMSAVWAARPRSPSLIIVALRLNHPPGATAAAADALRGNQLTDASRQAMLVALSLRRAGSTKADDIDH
jgi:hypothetical protein